MSAELSAADLEGSQGPGIVAANLVVAILATIAVALRFSSRRVQGLGFQADDYLILLALPLGWGMCVCTLLVSILLLYFRIFGRLRYLRLLAYILGIFSICWAIMVVLVCAFQCRPLALIWDKTVDGTCINAPLFFILGSAPNVITDFMVLALPMPAVWRLQTTTMQKISLTGIFLLGSLTCVISLVRFVQLIQNDDNQDVTWALGYVSIWSTAEPCLGIVAACLPTMRPLVRKFASSWLGGFPSSNSKGGGSDHSSSGLLGKVIHSHKFSSNSTTKQTSVAISERNSDSARNLNHAGGGSMETCITTGEVRRDCEPDTRAKGKPVNGIEVETSTSWLSGKREEKGGVVGMAREESR
ncbi:hypothetical protein EPUS_03145 [Endocarpon pusillum Z07020]|uniref:Rhodopsin domain-containing protein n=1 Tax=Endocarpon pusillum (strain Z07020 / HMAS-L-300199) TaxID=1263415 RepID=U1G7C5_ENDPU|nr:uncharacterized protein EPUS_03145 [Endocarpon pusillum Z07020]ERF73312.1 hypothetical protein EPUS_03145 [Endocarpon pusillum Z07020]